MAEKQRTIKRPVTVKGRGLHTGLEVEVTFKPAPENHGYVFKRIDLEGTPIVQAIADNVVDTSRSTVIEANGAKVGTVEHILSALSGLQIDNVLIEINAAETPIMDGSARYFVEALLEAEIEDQNAEREYYVVKTPISYSDPERGIELIIIPDDELSVNVMIDYKSKILSNQYATISSLKDYKTEIATCRTFVFLREVETLLAHNLIKGGDLDNAIVIVDREVNQEELDRLADLFNKPRMKVKSQGVLNNLELSFSNEPARHKLLDIIGDLALVGFPIKGRILATRPGHAANAAFAKIIRKEIKKDKAKGNIPTYNPNAKPLLDVNQIKKTLPHRPPFLLVDKIMEIKATEIIGIKSVTINEPFFVGHFPEEPVMPGVLIVEAMAQVGGILVLNALEDAHLYSTYFLKIDKVKYRQKVVPGDTLIFKLELTTPIRRGIAEMRGLAYVGSTLVTEGEFTAQIIKNKG